MADQEAESPAKRIEAEQSIAKLLEDDVINWIAKGLTRAPKHVSSVRNLDTGVWENWILDDIKVERTEADDVHIEVELRSASSLNASGMARPVGRKTYSIELVEHVVLRDVPRDQMKTEIQQYYDDHPGKGIYPSDVALALRFSSLTTFEITQELAEEGTIG